MNGTRASWPPRLRSARARSTVLIITVLVGISTLTGRGQQPAPLRVLMHEASMPAIDRGLRDQDPPREPRDGRSDSIETDRGDAPAYLAGSVIVKYADHASFDIENIPLTLDR